MGVFETSDNHPGRLHRPVRVPVPKQDIFGAAQEMCVDLAWTVKDVDAENLTIQCEKSGGLLGGTAAITVRVDGPDGIPSSTTTVRSESTGGVLSRDKSLVAEFVKKFTNRVC
jgi:hypothetical protein